MKTTTEGRMRNPPHPGAFIRTEILAPLELTVTTAVQVLGLSRPTLSSLLNGQADLSGDMALRIEKAFGVRMDTLMRFATQNWPRFASLPPPRDQASVLVHVRERWRHSRVSRWSANGFHAKSALTRMHCRPAPCRSTGPARRE